MSRTVSARAVLVLLLAMMGAMVGLAPQAALAQGQSGQEQSGKEQSLKVRVEVVLASQQGQQVQPPELEQMREAFKRKGLPFTSFQRLSLQTVEVSRARAVEVKLPSGVNASLRLLRLEGDVATLKVEVPQLSAVEVELGREGAVYQRAGHHPKGELVLVLSSPR